jgi:hypothetical protein
VVSCRVALALLCVADALDLLLCISIVDSDAAAFGCFVAVDELAMAGTVSAIAHKIANTDKMRFMLKLLLFQLRCGRPETRVSGLAHGSRTDHARICDD